MKGKVLFVDDEPNVLAGIRRLMHPHRNAWEARYANGPIEAIEAMKEERFDVIVSDIRMPGMDGVKLLGYVMDNYPATARIALTGETDQVEVLKTVTAVHQLLTKPCDIDLLIGIINGLRPNAWSHNPKIEALLAGMSSIPSLPSVYAELNEELSRETCSAQTIGAIVAKDVGLSTKVLHLVNSALFSLPRKVGNPTQAAMLLGTELTRALVATAGVFDQYHSKIPPILDLQRLVDHCLLAQGIARAVAQAEDLSKEASDKVAVAALLHDVGKLVLAANLPERWSQVKTVANQRKCPISKVEAQVFGGDHGQMGGYLLALWGFDSTICRAVGHHCNPRSADPAVALEVAIVHFADAISRNRVGYPDGITHLDEAYLAETIGGDRLQRWNAAADDMEVAA